MKRLVLIAIAVIYLLIGMVYSTMGMLVQVVLNNAGEQSYIDHVYQVNKAFVSKNDLLAVCVDGKYNNRNTEYWITVPVKDIETKPDELDGVNGYVSYWKEGMYHENWHLPRENIFHDPCDTRLKNVDREIPIEILDGGMIGSHESERILSQHFGTSTENELVYQLNAINGSGKPIESKGMAYANKEASFGAQDKNAFMFETNGFRKRGSALWYLALPFAWLLDVLSWPVQVYMWMEYAGAH